MTANCGPLAGMTPDQLRAALAAAQKAYTEMMLGQMGVSFSYAQGDGTRSVTYKATSLENLNQFIRDIQIKLGMRCSPRSRYQRFRY
ncbi:gpW family head-tail joining protein [Lelliottia aquatilis]|uniref:gpW family head-tail joining protein n=1 Tax=Lelliottia aquatilis TaxID=2080838 RepID=UPI001A9C80F5|nr:gpW family head-tail joining protein [Lelliottia aquatilis]